jgi:regulator of protease activity HflC (stomatin/prohibitin superfamily)
MKSVLRSIGSLLLAGLALLLLLYFSGTFYMVPEYKNAVVTRFGKVQQAVLTGFDVSEQFATERVDRC